MLSGVTRHMLPHPPGGPHLHVNRRLVGQDNNFARVSRFLVHFVAVFARLRRESV